MNNVNQLSGKKILITGATGFLGKHLCDHLLPQGVEIHAISRSQHTSTNPQLHWWQSDLEDIKIVEKLLHQIKPEIIFHLSGNITGAAPIELVLSTYHSLVTSTINILTVATQIQCQRVILIGSLEEPDGHSSPIPASPYAAAKWAATTYGKMFHQLYQTPVVIARTFMTYGPGQPQYKIIPSVILSLLQNQSPKLASGKREVDWIYVDDVINGLIVIAQTPAIEGQTFDLGSGQLIPIYQIIEKLTNLIPTSAKPLFGALPDRPVEKVTVADINNSKFNLNWQPKINIETGLIQTINYYKNLINSYSVTN